MFFGKKLREMRLKYAKLGIHHFLKKIDIDVNASEYNYIEHGYICPPDSEAFMKSIQNAFGVDDDNEEWKELCRLKQEKFVMQLMPEDVVISPLTHKTDGSYLTNDDLFRLNSYINHVAKEHNKKAREYNDTHNSGRNK